MNTNPLLQLAELGQSIWLDYTRRDLTESGDLQRLINNDGVKGMTSNPAIFEKAIADSTLYDADIQALAKEGKSDNEIYETISQRDIQAAADVFRSVYNDKKRADGFVSLEVNPHLAHDTAGTIEEARRLWRALRRPNVLIKVPATAEGVPAIRQLIGEGINVNVTLLFGLPRYREVAEAYIAGLGARDAEGKSIDTIASVASFFLSRIDTLVDPMLETLIAKGNAEAKEVHGQVAVASARIAYRIYKEVFHSERFRKLDAQGARSQRLLWASTSTKNPDYDDLKYLEPLIGPATINTVTSATLDAYRNHGDPAETIGQDLSQADQVMKQLAALGIDIDHVTQQLEDEGVEKFNTAFDKLMSAIEQKKNHE